ncbi:gamma-glutamyltransferase [Fodinibius sp. Rm-B-1B1-1]|uniref:gamma-glutamyltransferase n=1 Tax=Fodinibius alkaliphilus TaxID=3140241 RepID=UPI00315A59E4
MRIILQFLFALLIIIGTQTEQVFSQTGWAKSYENAVVVSAEKHASQIGKKILQQGGNAVDAAVAVQFALAVTEPRAGNIGGGGFMVLHLEDGTSKALDFRERAPERATKDMFIKNGEYQSDLSRRSALASGVPGVVDGMIKALERYGNLPLETVIEPAIKLAEDGFPLSWKQAQDLNYYADKFQKYRTSRRYFTKRDKTPYQEGDLFVQEDLAATLDRIARMGRDGFYSGLTADRIVNTMEELGGIINYRDLKNYESKWRDPVSVTYNGYNLHIMPPPSSGSIAIAQMLTMLENYDLKKLGFNSAEYVHLVTEVMRRAFADRAHFLGDPDFVNIPKPELLSETYNDHRMTSFKSDTITSSDNISHGDPISIEESTETTHYSIVDEQGNAVAVTTTLNGSFGNKIAVDGAGFLLNNEMDDFTAQPGEPNMFGLIQGKANAVAPKKRMLSSMSPTIVTKNDSTRMVLGAAGGPMIITATFHNFLNMAVFGMDPQKANSAPRFHHQWMPDKLYYEEFGLSPDTRHKLQKMGHQLEVRGSIGRTHNILVDDEGLKFGSPDPRGDGSAQGY